MIGLIIGSGQMPDPKQLQAEFAAADYTLCADGGAESVLQQGLLPDALLGDMDSIRPEDLSFLKKQGVTIYTHPARKDDTDMALAVRLLAEEGATHIRLLGATGTRMDHTLANLLLLPRWLEKGIRLSIVDAHNEITALQTETVTKKGDYLSVIPLDESIVVSLSGVSYPLDTHEILRGSTLGVSNEIVDDTAEVILHRGRGLLVQSVEAQKKEP